MRPVPACRSHGPHQPTLTAQLEAFGYAVSRSRFAYKRRISRGGVEVGHFIAEEAFGLLPRRPAPAVSADDVLAEMASRIDVRVAA